MTAKREVCSLLNTFVFGAVSRRVSNNVGAWTTLHGGGSLLLIKQNSTGVPTRL
jgi:hypothetical protein